DDNCTDVYSNDLGFLAIPDGDRIAGFNVLVGGGLGMTHGKKVTYPRLADPLGFATAEDVVPVAEAVLTVQRDYGDRRDRRPARLKYLLDDRGLDWFRGQVEQRLGRALPAPAPVGVSDVHDHLGWHDQGDGRSFYGLFVENGRILDTGDVQLRTALRRIVQLFGAGVHFTPQQNVLLTGIPDGRRSALEAVLAHHGVRSPDAISTVRRWSMACPALPTCGLALAESERVLPGVIDELERELARLGLADLRLTVRMTGCPNGCARPYTADLAFVGRSADKYTIFVGGSVLGTRLATAYADLVPRHRHVAQVRPLLGGSRISRPRGRSRSSGARIVPGTWRARFSRSRRPTIAPRTARCGSRRKPAASCSTRSTIYRTAASSPPRSTARATWRSPFRPQGRAPRSRCGCASGSGG